MARITVGGTTGDIVTGPDGRGLRTASILRWYASIDGAQLTGLLLNGQSVDEIPVPAGGYFPEHQWPDGVTVAWVAAATSAAGFVNARRYKYVPPGSGGGGVETPDATTTTAGKVRRSTAAEVDAGDDVNAYTTPARVMALVTTKAAAVKAEILGGASAAWDTLQEVKALVDAAEESSIIEALTTVVGGKLQKDQNLADLPDKAQARANLGVFTDTQQLVRWTGSAWPARPNGAPFGVVFLSTNDAAATAPPSTGLLVGDVWRKHPDAA